MDGTLAPDGSSSPDASDASPTSDGASPDATTPDAADAADAGPSALVRIAWFDDPAYTPALAASRFDVCLAPAGTTSWMGPLLTAAGGSGLAPISQA
jgi:hypothetical protein